MKLIEDEVFKFQAMPSSIGQIENLGWTEHTVRLIARSRICPLVHAVQAIKVARTCFQTGERAMEITMWQRSELQQTIVIWYSYVSPPRLRSPNQKFAGPIPTACCSQSQPL